MTTKTIIDMLKMLPEYSRIYVSGEGTYRTYLEAAQHSPDGYVTEYWLYNGALESHVYNGGH